MVLLFILIGIIIGIGVYLFLSDPVKELAITSVKEVFEISRTEEYVKTNVIFNGIKADLVLVVVLAIFSVMLIGKWLIYAAMMLKGIALSLYTILLFNIFGPLWGMLTVLLLVILVNIIYIPALVYLVVRFLEINFGLFKTRINGLTVSSFSKIIMTVLISFTLMFSSIVVEQIASSIVLNIYSKL